MLLLNHELHAHNALAVTWSAFHMENEISRISQAVLWLRPRKILETENGKVSLVSRPRSAPFETNLF